MEYENHDWLDMANRRNLPVFNRIVSEAAELFKFQVIDKVTLEQMFYHVINKIEEAEAAGEWKSEFISPDNRVVAFRGIRISQKPENPSEIVMTPLWKFTDEEEEDGEWV
jgi:hypothetical protein